MSRTRARHPPPQNAINTTIGRGRHLRGFPVNQKKWPRGCAWLDAGVAHGCARLAVKMAHGCAQRVVKMAHGCAWRGPNLAHGYNHVSAAHLSPTWSLAFRFVGPCNRLASAQTCHSKDEL